MRTTRQLVSSTKLALFDTANKGRKKILSNQTPSGRKALANFGRKHKEGVKAHARSIRTYQRMGGDLRNILHTK